MSWLELHSGKMPKVPRASRICSPLAELHNEMRKCRGAGAIKGKELEWGRGRKEELQPQMYRFPIAL